MTGARIAALMKANGWAINLFFILLGSYFVAGAANSVVARAIRVVPSIDEAPAGARATPARRSVKREDYASIAPRNLMAAKRENLSPVMEAAAPSEGEGGSVSGSDYDPNKLEKCSISSTLRATLVAEDPQWSLAVLYDSSEREPKVFSVNDGFNEIASDAFLVDILPREIIVRRRDHFEKCEADGDSKPAPRSRAPSKDDGPEESDPDGAVTKTGENEWQVDKGYLEENVLNNLSKVATQARIVPSFKNGKPNGFKLFSIKPKSIYAKIGLQNGDVIHKINGYEMNSPDRALEIYQKLKDASSVTVDMTRRGQQKTHNYNVR